MKCVLPSHWIGQSRALNFLAHHSLFLFCILDVVSRNTVLIVVLGSEINSSYDRTMSMYSVAENRDAESVIGLA